MCKLSTIVDRREEEEEEEEEELGLFVVEEFHDG